MPAIWGQRDGGFSVDVYSTAADQAIVSSIVSRAMRGLSATRPTSLQPQQ